jgi:SAM-dependent methyltransferase
MLPSGGGTAAVEYLEGQRPRGGRILDLGCGYGRDGRLFCARGFRVAGVDASEEAIRKARQFVPEGNFDVMDVRALTFPDASFDVVFANFLIHLFVDPVDRARITSEAARVLVPGGIALFTVASTEDADFGKGEEVARNVFRNERGVAKYYYNDADILLDFGWLQGLRVDPLIEHHTHDQPHTHFSKLIIGRK